MDQAMQIDNAVWTAPLYELEDVISWTAWLQDDQLVRDVLNVCIVGCRR